jgi:hypothetical protein
MVTRITFDVTGTREIEAAMKELGAQAANRIARSALNRAGTVVVQAARAKAPQPGSSEDPYATGELKRANRQAPAPTAQGQRRADSVSLAHLRQ